MKLLMENWKKFVNEKAVSGFDPKEFPNPLPPEQSKSFMTKGWDDSPDDSQIDAKKTDDQVPVQVGGGVPVDNAMPSQNAVFLGKALGMSMVPKLSSGGDIGAVISGDGHILDGHHRWAATMLRTGGGVDLQGTVVDLPITQLIPVLRSVGDAYGNQRKGEPKSGDLNIFSPEAADPETIKMIVDTGKYMDPKFYNREKLAAHVDSLGGPEVVAARVKQLQANAAKAYEGAGIAGAPPRLQMPVLEPKKGHVKGAAQRLSKGTIDVAPPYGDLEAGGAAHGGEDIEKRRKKMTKAVSEYSMQENSETSLMITRIGVSSDERYLVRWTNKGSGQYIPIWGDHGSAWKTTDMSRARAMKKTTEDRTGLNVAIDNDED